MNEFVGSDEPKRFDPPKEGLWPGESIVWTRRAGTGFWIIFFGFLIVMGGPFLTAISFDEFGMLLGAPMLILTIIGISFILNSLIKTRRTRYYLTTERIVEARGGRIIKEVSLEHFAGRPLSQFLETRVTHRSNNRPVHAIRIYDPVSDDVFELKGLDWSSAKAFERIGQILECSYCGFDNTAISPRCKNCGAIL